MKMEAYQFPPLLFIVKVGVAITKHCRSKHKFFHLLTFIIVDDCVGCTWQYHQNLLHYSHRTS